MNALNDSLFSVAQELVRLQPGGVLNPKELDRDEIPNFVTATSGVQVHFSKKALLEIQDIASILYANQTELHQDIRLDAFYKIVRQGIADCFCSDRLVDEEDMLLPDASESLRSIVLDAVSAAQLELTHYLPAWTMGVEETTSFQVGPVTFMTRDQWIESIDFPEAIKAGHEPEGTEWKRDLRSGLEAGVEPAKQQRLARTVLWAVRDCPSILVVAILPCEPGLSRHRARLAARTALDSLALIFENPEMHRQFILHDEPALPLGYSTLMGTEETLWFPGSYKFPRGWNVSPSFAAETANEYKALIEACGHAISATLDPDNHSAPNLAKRWVTALRWHADGCRETDDSIALAKHATCLDILACGGKAQGIIELIGAHLGVTTDERLFNRPELTVSKAVAELYNAGRSRVLHGTYADPMKSFTEQRSRATILARILLRVSVRNWETYSGPDTPKAFRAMGKASE